MESEDYAKDMFDFIREDYEHWVEENVDKFNSLLCSIKNEREDEAIKDGEVNDETKQYLLTRLLFHDEMNFLTMIICYGKSGS
jgi:hypothetical protein